MLNKLKSILKWVGTDGLLHFLVCYAMMLTLTPLMSWWALIPTVIVALAKEAWDYFVQKDNNREQVIHDIICDGVGIACSLLTMGIWWLSNL